MSSVNEIQLRQAVVRITAQARQKNERLAFSYDLVRAAVARMNELLKSFDFSLARDYALDEMHLPEERRAAYRKILGSYFGKRGNMVKRTQRKNQIPAAPRKRKPIIDKQGQYVLL